MSSSLSRVAVWHPSYDTYFLSRVVLDLVLLFSLKADTAIPSLSAILFYFSCFFTLAISTISGPMAYASLSIPFFAQLVHRLRRINARYRLIAYHYRRTHHPTHHARRRADRAGLWIDTSIARAKSPDTVTGSSTDDVVEEEGEGEGNDGDDAESDAEYSPEVELVTSAEAYLSPLDLGLCPRSDDVVPGAPRLRTRPLPKDEWRTVESELDPYVAALGLGGLCYHGDVTDTRVSALKGVARND